MLDASGTQHLLLAETLGLAMARRASDILERHRAALTGSASAIGEGPADTALEADENQFACDNAIFTAVLDAANECLGRFDTRPADDRWCDALLQVIHLAQLSALLSVVSRGDDPPYPAVTSRGDDPPYPPVSVRPGLIAKAAIISGPPARTKSC
ncbi:MAG: hypothetical protein ACRDNO_20265 [Trebonia sp.]